MRGTFQRLVGNRKMALAILGILVVIVAVSYLSAAPPSKPGSAQTQPAKPAAPTVDSKSIAKDPSKITRANYDQIQSGMSEEEVTAILGGPGGSSTQRGTVNGHPFNKKSMTWRSADRTVTITIKFTDGKITGRNFSKITPKQP